MQKQIAIVAIALAVASTLVLASGTGQVMAHKSKVTQKLSQYNVAYGDYNHQYNLGANYNSASHGSVYQSIDQGNFAGGSGNTQVNAGANINK